MNHKAFSPVLTRMFAVLCAFSLVLSAVPPQARAQGAGPMLIRDTEIETILKDWSAPVIKAAQLEPDSVKMIIVQDNNINAFVAGGPNIFLFTGLLTRSEDPLEIIGVIGHEVGHISGGHLVRARGAMQNASYESLLGTLVGLGAAVLTGEGGLASAIVAGTQSSAYGRYLAFSRVQESSADQAALDYLERAKMNPEGLVSFMHKLEDQELLPSSQQSQYVRTHPLTRDRIEALQAGKARSAFKDQGTPPEWQEQHRRMLAKLVGFITPEQVEWKYDSRDTSIPAAYARAIAAYRRNRTADALSQIDALLVREPNNPYFLELKGQMLVDFGRVEESLPPYRKAVEIMPEASLIRTAYAHALIESAGRDQGRLNEGINHLQRAVKDENRSPRIHRLLATAYGRLGQESRAKLHLAEEALLKGEIPYAKRQAEAAVAGLEKGSQPWVRAQDILNFIEQNGEDN